MYWWGQHTVCSLHFTRGQLSKPSRLFAHSLFQASHRHHHHHHCLTVQHKLHTGVYALGRPCTLWSRVPNQGLARAQRILHRERG